MCVCEYVRSVTQRPIIVKYLYLILGAFVDTRISFRTVCKMEVPHYQVSSSFEIFIKMASMNFGTLIMARK